MAINSGYSRYRSWQQRSRNTLDRRRPSTQRSAKDYKSLWNVTRDMYGTSSQRGYNALSSANPRVTRYNRGMTLNVPDLEPRDRRSLRERQEEDWTSAARYRQRMEQVEQGIAATQPGAAHTIMGPANQQITSYNRNNPLADYYAYVNQGRGTAPEESQGMQIPASQLYYAYRNNPEEMPRYTPLKPESYENYRLPREQFEYPNGKPILNAKYARKK